MKYVLQAIAMIGLLGVMPVQAAEKSKPNIIVILADDWGLGDVKTYGGERCKVDTPHMDQLAAKGMKFTDAKWCRPSP